MRTISITLLAILAVHSVLSARILGLFPHPGKSHQMVFDALMRELAERGHEVTVVSFFPIKDPPPNYTSVSLEGVAPLAVESLDLSQYENPSRILKFLGIDRIIKHIIEFPPLADLGVSICSKIVDFAQLADVLKKSYDIFFVETFNSDCMLGLAHVYGLKVPFVSITAVTAMEWGPDRIGVSDNPSYVPILSCGFRSPMNFIQRLENAVMNIVYKVWYRYGIQMREQAIIEKRFGRKIPDLQDLAKNVSLNFVNAFHSLNGVQPLLPGVVEVGGMFLNKSRNSIPHPEVRKLVVYTTRQSSKSMVSRWFCARSLSGRVGLPSHRVIRIMEEHLCYTLVQYKAQLTPKEKRRAAKRSAVSVSYEF